MVHLEQDGVPLAFLLDVVELTRSHSGMNLVQTFAETLQGFGIDNKVSCLSTLILK